jgi:predicted RNA binding protein YcfA (HicA-like mRNA interferase family)
MKTPRDITGESLIKLLCKAFGYFPTRQTGSHVRLTTIEHGVHHLTVPKHNPVRVGTLAKILGEVALHFGISREEANNRLFS